MPRSRKPTSIRSDDLGVSPDEVLVVRRTGVPPIDATALGKRSRVLHERDALALDRVCDESLRPPVVQPEPVEHRADGTVIVAVAALDVPAEGGELRLQVAEREDLLGRLVGLQLVPIDDDPEAADPLVDGGLERLEVLSLLQLPVARPSRRRGRRAPGAVSPRRSRGPWRHPFQASRSWPRSQAPRRPGARRARRAAAAVTDALSESHRARAAPHRSRARRAPSTRRRRRGRGAPSRARPRSAPRRGGARRGRVR